MSPEYVLDGHYSDKSDVFSYGVLVIETISGQRNWGFQHPDHELNLLGHVSDFTTSIIFMIYFTILTPQAN